MKDWENSTKENPDGWMGVPLEDVKKNMHLTGYPKENMVFVKGDVLKTIPKIIPNKISLLRLDTDWYKSTKHNLINLYPLLSMNGIVILDDYGVIIGTRKATDEYFSNKKIFFCRMDKAGVIGQKTSQSKNGKK